MPGLDPVRDIARLRNVFVSKIDDLDARRDRQGAHGLGLCLLAALLVIVGSDNDVPVGDILLVVPRKAVSAAEREGCEAKPCEGVGVFFSLWTIERYIGQ